MLNNLLLVSSSEFYKSEEDAVQSLSCRVCANPTTFPEWNRYKILSLCIDFIFLYLVSVTELPDPRSAKKVQAFYIDFLITARTSSWLYQSVGFLNCRFSNGLYLANLIMSSSILIDSWNAMSKHQGNKPVKIIEDHPDYNIIAIVSSLVTTSNLPKEHIFFTEYLWANLEAFHPHRLVYMLLDRKLYEQ